MVTATESKPEQLDLDTISEYVRESKPRPHELLGASNKGAVTAPPVEKKLSLQSALFAEDETVKPIETDVLETLWPGLHHHHDFAHSLKKKTPTFYMIAGFSAGILAVSLVVWFCFLLSSFFTHSNGLSNSLSSNKQENTESTASSNKILVPLVSTYEVQEGDTLAGIALRNYKHISPRLLDSICRANNLSDANVLTLGQKITLPEYYPQQ